MRIVRLIVLCVALVSTGSCAWDGPDAAVRVVTPALTSPNAADQGTVGEPRAVGESRDRVSTRGAVTGAAAGSGATEESAAVELPRTLPATVAVVGDSLTLAAEQEILDVLTADGFDVVTVDGLESRRMTHGGSAVPPGTSAIDDIQEIAAPDLWVIALGTNDVASVGSLDGFRAEMRELLDLLPDDVPVVWVDLWIRDRQPAISGANRLIRAELQTWRGGAAVVDWFSHGAEDGIITGDGVHLTDTGRQLFATSISATIDEMFADQPVD